MTALAFEVAAGTSVQPPLVFGVRLIPSAWGMKVLGHPLGSDAYCRHYFAKVAANTEETVVAIKRMAEYAAPVAMLLYMYKWHT